MLTLVGNWRELWKSWCVMVAVLGTLLPELLQVVADNTDLIPSLTAGDKSGIRLACLILVVVLRPIRQNSLAPKDVP